MTEPCGNDICGRPGVVYMAGPTLGSSPRLTFIAGKRAAELATPHPDNVCGPLQLRCWDCAGHALDELVKSATRDAEP